MSSRGSSNGGGGIQAIPAVSRKMVQSLKEIVNCPEPEVYAMLKECNMDPNEAVNRLLSQDPFHEVKSKREKKKENKDTTESRSHGIVSSTSSRWAKGGTDNYDGCSGSTLYNYESGALHGKLGYKKENGTNNYASPSFVSSGMAGSNMSRQPPTHSDSVTTKYKATAIGAGDGISLQASWGYQPPWSGVPGQLSMAEIVKMGRPHDKASSTTNTTRYGVNDPQVNCSPCNLLLSEDYLSEPGVGNAQHVSPTDGWPLVEQPPTASSLPVLGAHVASELHADVTNISSDRNDHHPELDTDEFQGVEDDDFDNTSAVQTISASVSTRNIRDDNSGGASLFNRDIYQNMGSYQPHDSGFERQGVDHGVSVSSVTSNLQKLSVQEEDLAATQEDKPSVIIPSHLQIQTGDCSHLRFGSFGSGIISSFPGPFSSGLKGSRDEESVDGDAPAVGPLETRYPEYYGDDSLKTDSDGTLLHRTGASAGSYGSPSTSQPDVVKPENIETTQKIQYSFPSSSSTYDFENGQQWNAPFPHSQAKPQMQNLAPFSSLAYSNSLQNSSLAASVQPVRESDLQYSPFPMAQSLNTKYSNKPSSISGSTISVEEALRTVGFSSTPQTAHAQGPALPQHLAAHLYSQPNLPLGPFANMIGYPFLPQSYTYVPSAFQQAYSGNNTYNQSLAAMLPQYKNSLSVSSLPQSTDIASGYGGVGNSTNVPGNFPLNPPATLGPTAIDYDIMSSHSQYKDNNPMISLQQNENSGMLAHGLGSRTVSAVPGSTYYSLQGQNQQQPSGYRQTQQQPSLNYGAHSYPNFYYSLSENSLDHQQQNSRDGLLGGFHGQPSKQSQHLWQNSY